jgi:hypothetical protein
VPIQWTCPYSTQPPKTLWQPPRMPETVRYASLTSRQQRYWRRLYITHWYGCTNHILVFEVLRYCKIGMYSTVTPGPSAVTLRAGTQINDPSPRTTFWSRIYTAWSVWHSLSHCVEFETSQRCRTAPDGHLRHDQVVPLISLLNHLVILHPNSLSAPAFAITLSSEHAYWSKVARSPQRDDETRQR